MHFGMYDESCFVGGNSLRWGLTAWSSNPLRSPRLESTTCSVKCLQVAGMLYNIFNIIYYYVFNSVNSIYSLYLYQVLMK